MSDLISREALLEAIKGVDVAWYLDGNYETYDDTTIVYIIEQQPTIEGISVVHCKDCTKWGCGLPMETDAVKCCGVGGYMVDKNGYCVYGERE